MPDVLLGFRVAEDALIKDTQTIDGQVWYFVEVSSMNISGYIWDSLVDIAD
jgi:hypothetical protein